MKMLSIASVGMVGLSAMLSLVAYGQMSMGAATNDRKATQAVVDANGRLPHPVEFWRLAPQAG